MTPPITKQRITMTTKSAKSLKPVESESKLGDSSEPSAVTVRMYCHGLGDCFLLTFPRKSMRPFYMLIDCGVILGTSNSRAVMKNVVSSIAQVTTELDVLVVTHEHWDHVSGFCDAEEEFKKLTVHNVWVAWTENPTDPLARKLKAEKTRTITALTHAASQLRGAQPGAEESLLEVLGFFGPSAVGVAGAHSTERAMDNAIGLSAKPPRYCLPTDDPFNVPELQGVRFYVLGPPHNEQRIKRALPTKSGKETYLSSLALTPETAFMMAACRGAAEQTDLGNAVLQELARPFDSSWCISKEEAKNIFFFCEHYLGSDDSQDQVWRNIDTAWLGTAGQLALQLDTYTNNTSLVLAIEFTDTDKVFLFAADAQVGNWLSWADQSWQVGEGGERKEVSSEDLLRRTILYKVGHHGSHNATLRANGLELMTSPELIALVPVNREMAIKKRWAGMPFPSLLNRLMDKTAGRVLRIDDQLTPAQQAAPQGTPAPVWTRFQQNVKRSQDGLYYEITFPELMDVKNVLTRPSTMTA
jgi:hypothetical protein